ncbi:MAG: TolC family protein [Myxococcota bacterium]
MLALPVEQLLVAVLAAAVSPAPSSGLSLEESVALALSRNERAQIASLQTEAAVARVAQARAFFFPELVLSGGYTRRPGEVVRDVGGTHVTIQSLDALFTTATARWTLFDARGFPLYRTARLARDAARLEEGESKRLLGFEAADAFLRTLSTEQVYQAAVRRQELAQTSLAQARQRFAAKLVSVNDVTRAELELATAQREATLAQGEARAAVVQLAFLLDAEVRAPLVVPTALLETAARELESEAALLAKATASRLDIFSAVARAESAEAFANEPWMRFLPSVSLRGQYRLTNEPGLIGRTGEGTVGADASWVLFDQGLAFAQADERDAAARIARLSARLTVREVEVQVREAIISLQSAQSALAQAAVAAIAARKNADEVAELYRQGLASALEVADSSVALFEAEVALARERYGMALAYLNLRAAIGVDPLGREVER